MVHGGTRTGTTYTGTPDGRESWAQYFARRGYAVYVVDQPGRGRSGYVAEAYGPQSLADGESGQRRYLQQEKFKLWPQAHLHTQWPGNGAPDDPVTLQMTGSYVPEIEGFRQGAVPQPRRAGGAPRQDRALDPAGAFAGRRLRVAGRGCAARPGEGDRGRSSRTGRPSIASSSSARRIGSRRAPVALPLRRHRPFRSPMRPPSRTPPSSTS